MVAVFEGRFAGGFQLLGALVQQQAEVHRALVIVPQAGQHPEQLLRARLGAGRHLLHHLAAGVFLAVEGGRILLVGQGEPGLEEGLAEKFHQTGELVAQMFGTDVVLALAAGGQVQHDLFVQGQVGQRLP